MNLLFLKPQKRNHPSEAYSIQPEHRYSSAKTTDLYRRNCPARESQTRETHRQQEQSKSHVRTADSFLSFLPLPFKIRYRRVSSNMDSLKNNPPASGEPPAAARGSLRLILKPERYNDHFAGYRYSLEKNLRSQRKLPTLSHR